MISEILYISIVGLITITLSLSSIACKKKGLVLIYKPKEGSLDMINRLKMSKSDTNYYTRKMMIG